MQVKKQTEEELAADNRLFIEAVLWSSIQASHGETYHRVWQMECIFKRYRRWVQRQIQQSV